jgi:ubiquinone/menaquinone biosynthesis C-methylase UbiE
MQFVRASKRQAHRALERQLAYQRRKALQIAGHEEAIMASMAEHSRAVRAKIEKVRKLKERPRVLEVGSGAHGLIFFFEGAERVGIDPLADEYRKLFPEWQERAKTIAAFGENLPFSDAKFDIVLCDNVVDHAEHPRRILEEISRVLAPSGLVYFTVNVHHPLYHLASTLHERWRRLGVPFEVTPFADHTVHLTPSAARHLFAGVPLKIVWESAAIDQAKTEVREVQPRHLGDRLKRWFYKNARWEVVAEKW